MYANEKLWIAKAEQPIYLLPKMANRHGLISGATGTGKTITLKVMAESFSDLGVPVFLADIKGDLAGMCRPGIDSEGMQKRIQRFGLAEANFTYKDYPTRFWDVFGKNGHPVRTTVSEMGPLLLGRLLDLNDTQSGVLNIVFRVADDRGLLLLDLKDLKAMLSYVANNAKSFTLEYGNIAAASVGAIQRSILSLEDQGGEQFFGEPELEITDWMRTGNDGRGYINILHCVELFHSPALYSTFLLWMLSELFETLPEMGDLKKPRMVFFFDEAHLLFDEAPKVLLQKIEQVVRLIRSKGVGVYFITQSQGHPRHYSFTAWQQGTTRASRLLTGGTEGSQGCRRNFQTQPGLRNRRGNNTARYRRGSRLFPCRRRKPRYSGKGFHPSAAESDGNSR